MEICTKQRERNMSTTDQEELIFDRREANLRRVGGVIVQSIPAEWRKLAALKAFFESDLIIQLVRKNGQICIEIKTNPEAKH